VRAHYLFPLPCIWSQSLVAEIPIKTPVETAEFVLAIWLLYAVRLLHHCTKWKRRFVKWICSRSRVHRAARRIFKLGPQQMLFSVTGQKVFQNWQNAIGLCTSAPFPLRTERDPFFQMLCSCQVLSGSREKYLLASSCPFIHLSVHISAVPTGRISVKFDTGDFMKIFEKLQFWLKSDRKVRHSTWRQVGFIVAKQKLHNSVLFVWHGIRLFG
jgi:hypothetical protein